MPSPDIRKGMPARELNRETFEQRFKSSFIDPVFAPLQRELQAITTAAWNAYADGRKAPAALYGVARRARHPFFFAAQSVRTIRSTRDRFRGLTG